MPQHVRLTPQTRDRTSLDASSQRKRRTDRGAMRCTTEKQTSANLAMETDLCGSAKVCDFEDPVGGDEDVGSLD
eukprot:2763418-Rhodomonas_salina.1